MSILPDLTAKFITTPDAYLLPLSLQLHTAALWALTPGREEAAIALIEHVAQTWHTEHDDQKGGGTWH